MSEYLANEQISFQTILDSIVLGNNEGRDAVFLNWDDFYLDTKLASKNVISAKVAISPVPPGNVVEVYYYKMIGEDSGLSGVNYVSWVVENEPDYIGAFAPVTVGPLVNIYVSSIKKKI
jgi:hypothetical protein